MSEVNYRRNGMKYSTTGKCWGMAPKAGEFASDRSANGPKPKSSRERRAAKKRRSGVMRFIRRMSPSPTQRYARSRRPAFAWTTRCDMDKFTEKTLGCERKYTAKLS